MLSPDRIVDAVDRNRLDVWKFFAERGSEDSFAVRDGVEMVRLSPIARLFNSALVADVEPGREVAAIHAASEFFQGRSWYWTVGPLTRPDHLPAALREAGFVHAFDSPGMAMDLRGFESAPDEGIVEVRDRVGLTSWLDTLNEAFGMPPEASEPFLGIHDAPGPNRSFLVTDGETPVATGMVYYGAGVAGIYCIGTVPAARGRGFGTRVTRACLVAALEDGYDVAILQSSSMGLPVYKKLGFRTVCQVGYFTPPEAE